MFGGCPNIAIDDRKLHCEQEKFRVSEEIGRTLPCFPCGSFLDLFFKKARLGKHVSCVT